MTTIHAGFSDWRRYGGAIESVLDQIPTAKNEFLRSTLARYRNSILTSMLAQNIRHTGTYEESVGIDSTGSSDEPELSIIIEPKGPNADRLPIYWKVLEFGSRPIWNLGKESIRDWVSEKIGGGEGDLARITNSIRSYGVRPHPVLSNIFILTPPEGEIAGLTPLAIGIAEEEAQAILDRLLNTLITPTKTGKMQARHPAGSPGGIGGRYRSLRG
jgi:hypothetical protein